MLSHTGAFFTHWWINTQMCLTTTPTEEYNYILLSYRSSIMKVVVLYPFRFTHCNQFNYWWPVQDTHLHLHWWACYHCHLEERWGCDKSQCYPPADQEISWCGWWYLPDSAHLWPISGLEWHSRNIQLHSGECQGRVFQDGVCTRWDFNSMFLYRFN